MESISAAESPALWEGDTDAFERLYEQYYRFVFQLALRVSADSRIAEDVSQTVFLKLWLSRGKYRNVNLAGWLSRVTRNETIDLLRRVEHASMRYTAVHESADRDVVFDEVYDRWETSWVRATLIQALATLPNKERVAIMRNFFEGLTQVEIAAMTGDPLGTIKTRIRAGRQRLRGLVAAEAAAQGVKVCAP